MVNQVKVVVCTLGEFLSALSAPRRKQLWSLLLLMLTAAVAEVVSLGALVPFLSLLADQQGRGPAARFVGGLLGDIGLGHHNSALMVTIFFAVVVVTAAVVRVTLNLAMAKTNFRIGHEVGSEIYRRSLFQPYEYHAAHNSSEIVGRSE